MELDKMDLETIGKLENKYTNGKKLTENDTGNDFQNKIIKMVMIMPMKIKLIVIWIFITLLIGIVAQIYLLYSYAI